MNIIVQKYGGKSVETIEKMHQIADKIVDRANQGNSIVVVISAMGETTDNLIKMAKYISLNPCKRELDVLLSTGEQVSIALLSMILKNKGYSSISLTGFQAGIKTYGMHTKNKIMKIDINKIKKHLHQGKIVIVAGFQGINKKGDITTLGRGGSDTTAVALAAKFQCICEIYTDVEGIYSIDPRIYSDAKKLEYISYEEMMEMSSLGSKVMETRSIGLGKRYGIPIYVASSQKSSKGSYIKEYDGGMEPRSITGLSVCDNVLMMTVNHMPYSLENMAYTFERLASQDVNIDIISRTSLNQGYVNISFTTSKDDESTVDEIMNDLKKKFDAIEIQKESSITKISVVGWGIRYETEIVAKIYKLFADNLIELKQVTTSKISISYTIKSVDKHRAIDILTSTFNL